MSKKVLLATVALLGFMSVPAMAAETADDPVAAKVNGAVIKRSEVLKELQFAAPQLSQLPIKEIFPKLAEKMALTKAVSEKGYADGLQKDPEVVARLKTIEAQLVAEAYIQKQVEPKITEARIKARYDELAAKYKPQDEVRARHILITPKFGPNATAKEKADADAAAKAEAETILKEVQGGADFAKVAEEKSSDVGSAKSGGDLGYFLKESMVKPFADAAFTINPGTIGKDIVKTDFGYHIIKVEDKRKSKAPPLEEVKAGIIQQLGQQLANEEIEAVEKKAKIEIFDFDGKPVPKEKKK
ncbi:MAG: peptidylprolyl isomerase [Alphaproteobacteria bacterium]|nr:peptidylprolyl isomerase [Alphaproteobacteria bacterium]MCL2505828.1 peptidylprolyl isomerase [Alphaproteobacteria bacterium]